MPVMVGTGLGIGWALRHCKNVLGKKDSTKQISGAPEDPCACCDSKFEELDKNEFGSDSEATAPVASTMLSPPPPPQEMYEEVSKKLLITAVK